MFSALELKIITGLAAIAALLVMFGLYTAHQREVGAATVRAEVAQAAAAQAASAASETARRLIATQETVHVAQTQLAAASAAAGAAERERDAARMQLTAYVRRRAVSADSAASAGSSPAVQSDLLLAELLDASWERNVRLAKEADERGVAGSACVKAYDTLIGQH
jgi:hypothetical protein